MYRTMKTRNILFLLLSAGLMASCGSGRDKAVAEIKDFEDALFNDKGGIVSREKADDIVTMYVDFSETYPEDSLAVEYLFKAADISMNMNRPVKAVELYSLIREDYPDFRKAPECLFLKGYVYENYMNDLEKARAIYTEFIEKYPDNDFADDAEISIRNLGKSPEELIKEFEEKMDTQESAE